MDMEEEVEVLGVDTKEEVEVLGVGTATEEEVEILRVDYGADCVCTSRNRSRRTHSSVNGRGSSYKVATADLGDCIIIGKSESERSGSKAGLSSKSGSITDLTSNGISDHSTAIHSQSPRDPSVDAQTKAELPTASGSSPVIKTPSIDELSDDPLLDSIFSAINNDSAEVTSAQTTKDQTVPTIAPFHVPLPHGILTEVSRTPKCWTVCPNCPVGAERKYHLIDVMANSAEWAVVATQLVNAGFVVSRIRRIQNESLWQRLCYEKQLMLREKKTVNEQLLYHTSQGEVEVIAEEGLDSRLSTNGCFGNGIYFSDNPIKCNNYWRLGFLNARHMFCCRVLLGDIKKYPDGASERLKREPRKEKLKPGDQNKYYDSVKGNLSGQNEFVVYNMYRVMPEYVVCYHIPRPQCQEPSQFHHMMGLPVAQNLGRVLPPLSLGSQSAQLQQMLKPKRKKKRKRR